MKIEREKRVGNLALGGAMLFSLLGVAACGGGSDGGVVAGGSTTFSASSSGVASKGIIKSGAIIAEELASDGSVLATVGTGETDAKGAYSLDIGSNYKGGPLRLTISGKTDGTTKMVCDVLPDCGASVSFGSDLPLDETFKMTAIIPPVSNGAKVSAQITPFTHMAARRALAAPTLDAATVKSAISEVNQMVGINILDVAPLDITDVAQVAAAGGSGALVYAAFVAGAGSVAMSGGDLQTGLDNMAQAFEDGTLTAGEAVTAADLMTAVQNVANKRDITDPNLQQVISTVQAQIGADGSYDPKPADTATLTAVEQARSVIAQTRAMGVSLAALETPANAFGTNIDVASAVLDTNSQQLGDTLGLVLASVGEWLDTATDTSGTQPVTVFDSFSGKKVGTVNVTLTDNGGIGIRITGSNVNGASVDLTASSSISSADIASGTAFNLSSASLRLSGLIENAKASMSLDRMAFSANFAEPLTIDLAGTTPPAEPVLTGASLSGAVTLKAAAVSFTGSASLSFVSLPGKLQADTGSVALSKLSLSGVALKGQFSDAQGSSFSADASLKINNASGFDTLGALLYEETAWVYDSRPNDVLGAAAYAADFMGISSLDKASYSSQSAQTCFSGLTDLGTYVDPSCVAGDVLGVVNYAVAIERRGAPLASRDVGFSYDAVWGASLVTAELQFPPFESIGNFANVTLGLTLDLSLKGYPDTKAVFTGNRTKLMGADARLTLTHDGKSITFAADLNKPDDMTPATGTLTVTTPDGAALMLSSTEGEKLSGTLKVGSAKVGSIEQTGRGLLMVRYGDGTFETLQ